MSRTIVFLLFLVFVSFGQNVFGQFGRIYDFPTGRIGQTGHFFPNEVFVFGGVDSAGNYLSDSHMGIITSMPLAVLDSLAPMPTARAFASSVGLPNGHILVMGGENQFGETGAVEEYDPVSDSWIIHPAMVPLSRSSAVWADGEVHLFGGQSGSFVLNIHLIYNVQSRQWRTGPAMPVGLCDHEVARVPNPGLPDRIYIFGGRTMAGIPSAITNQVWMLDGLTGVYSAQPPMAQARAGFALSNDVGFSSHIHVYGGHTPSGVPTSLVENFFTSSNSWSPYTFNMPFAAADIWGQGNWDDIPNSLCFYFYLFFSGGMYPNGSYSAGGYSEVLIVILPLPGLELSGSETERGVLLEWKMDEIAGVEFLKLEWENNEGEWEDLSKFAGETSVAQSSFLHQEAKPGRNLYRMVAVDQNGEAMGSETVEVNMVADRNNEIQVWPNPASGFLRVSWEEIDLRKISLFDLSGRKVSETKLQSGEIWDLEGLDPGVYFLEIKGRQGTQSQRIIIK